MELHILQKRFIIMTIGGAKMQNEFVKRCYKSDLHYQVHYVTGTNVNSAYSAQLHYDMDLTVAYFKKASGSIKIEGNSYEFRSLVYSLSCFFKFVHKEYSSASFLKEGSERSICSVETQ